MKAIVFGGAGFVGSHVADALTAAGHDVTVFDQNESLYLQNNQRFIQGDILESNAVQQAVIGQDVVYNFAGLADIDEAMSQPIDTAKLNILGCLNQLEAARLHKITRFVQASSIYVHSEMGGFYRVSKQACELYIEEFQRRFGLDYTILRYGTIYGRRADEQNTIYRCLRQALVNRRIKITGFKDAVREYIHIQDAAQSSEQILNKEFRNQIVTITGHQPMKFIDLLTMIKEILGTDIEIEVESPGSNSNFSGHYKLTPYSFRPKLSRKLASNHYIDLGQGLVDCLEEIQGLNKGEKRES